MNVPRRMKCLNDGAMIPLVGVGRAWPKPEVRFFLVSLVCGVIRLRRPK